MMDIQIAMKQMEKMGNMVEEVERIYRELGYKQIVDKLTAEEETEFKLVEHLRGYLN